VGTETFRRLINISGGLTGWCSGSPPSTSCKQLAASVTDAQLQRTRLKDKILYRTGLMCGLVPLTVGLFIFFSWWTARAFFAIGLHSFEGYGFLWTLISIPIAFVGLLLLIIFLIRNFQDNWRHSVIGLLIILVNIPVCYWVLTKQAELDRRAYIKMYNKTKQDNLGLTLKTSDFEKQLGTLDDGETLVDFYYPKYIDERHHDSYPTIDSVKLIVTDEFTTRYLTLPRIDKGECTKLYLDNEFKLLDQW